MPAILCRKRWVLDDQLAECLIAMSGIAFWYDWEFSRAVSLLEKALSIAPGNAEGMGFLGLYQAFGGEVIKGKQQLEKGLRADPYSLQLHFGLCAIYHMEEDYEAVEREADIILQLHPHFWRGHIFKGHAAYCQERYDEAIVHFGAIIQSQQEGVFATAAGALACCYLKKGDADQANAYLWQVMQAFENNSTLPCAAYSLAMYYLESDQPDQSIAYLREGVNRNVSDFVFLPRDPMFRPLWDHPEFVELTREIERRRQLAVPENKTRYANSNLREEDACDIDERLVQFMEEEKPFLDNQLSLRQLADDLEVNTNYLSQVINERHGKNFVEFVNEYRVSALKEKLENPENRQFTLLSLAFDCGFNSKTTFNTAFKKITGLTPSQYLKKVG